MNDYDLRDLFSQYGQINRIDSKINYAFITIYASELSVVKCVCELDGRLLKKRKMKVAFMRGSYEDTQGFKDKYKEEIEKFTSAEHKKSLSTFVHRPPKVKLSQIGEGRVGHGIVQGFCG